MDSISLKETCTICKANVAGRFSIRNGIHCICEYCISIWAKQIQEENDELRIKLANCEKLRMNSILALKE